MSELLYYCTSPHHWLDNPMPALWFHPRWNSAKTVQQPSSWCRACVAYHRRCTRNGIQQKYVTRNLLNRLQQTSAAPGTRWCEWHGEYHPLREFDVVGHLGYTCREGKNVERRWRQAQQRRATALGIH